MKQRSIWFSALLLLCALVRVQNSAAQPVSNFYLVDSLSLRIAQDMAAQFPAQTIMLDIPDHPAAWLIRQNSLRALSARSMRTEKDTVLPIQIGIAGCGVRYALHSERDSLLRTIRVELRFSAEKQPPTIGTYTYSDVIARSDIPLVESPRYDFTTAPPPSPPPSAWDEILEPLIVVAALATTVTLLFTVRSQ